MFSLNAFGEGQTEINGKPLSKSEERLLYASAIARSILDNPPAHSFQTARQRAAAELLYYWGRLLQPPETQPNHKNLLVKSIRNYIACLGENEARPFLCLLDNDQEQPNSEKNTLTLNTNLDNKIPGKQPNTAIGKLAVKAAWEIECSTKKRPTARIVLAKLQDWADEGKYPETLSKSNKPCKAVTWLTGKSNQKDFTIEACEKALEIWNKSRF